MDRGAGADGQRVPATRVLPGHVLAAPSRVIGMALSPTLGRDNGGTRGRLRANPGSSRCFPCPSALRSPNQHRQRPAPRRHQTSSRPNTNPTPRPRPRPHTPQSTPPQGGRHPPTRRPPRQAGPPHRPPTRHPPSHRQAGRSHCPPGEQGADERGSSGRTQGSRADAPSSLRCHDPGLVTEPCQSREMGRRARALGGPASQGPTAVGPRSPAHVASPRVPEQRPKPRLPEQRQAPHKPRPDPKWPPTAASATPCSP